MYAFAMELSLKALRLRHASELNDRTAALRDRLPSDF
jgi:hypothetical protein